MTTQHPEPDPHEQVRLNRRDTVAAVLAHSAYAQQEGYTDPSDWHDEADDVVAALEVAW